MLIDVAIPGDRNVIQNEAEKILKYKDLAIDIQCMWNVKTRVITSNNRSDRNHFKIVQKMREHHTRKS
jgi:phage FluMu gp28-like protein